MEWRPNNISKSELEKKQAEYMRKALEMAKKSEYKPRQKEEVVKEAEEIKKKVESIIITKPDNSDKEIVIHTVEPIPEAAEEAEIITVVEKKIENEATDDIDEIINSFPRKPMPVRVTEVDINAEFELDATIYRKSPVQVEAVEDEVVDNPFKKAEPCECGTERQSTSTPPPRSFNSFINGHNQEFCNCEKCKGSKKN